MLRSCFGLIKTVVSCTSELLRDKTRRAQHRSKIALQAFRSAFSQSSCEKLVPSALRGVPGASGDVPRAARGVPGASQERPGPLPNPAGGAPGAFRSAPDRPRSQHLRKSSALTPLRNDFSSILVSLGPIRERPGSDFGTIFVPCVRSCVRLFVAAFGRRSFVRSLVCAVRSRLRSSFVCSIFVCFFLRSFVGACVGCSIPPLVRSRKRPCVRSCMFARLRVRSFVPS